MSRPPFVGKVSYETASSNHVISVAETSWTAKKEILWGADGYLYGTGGNDIQKYDATSHNSFTLIDNSSGPINGIGAFAYVPEPTVVALVGIACVFSLQRRLRLS